MTCSQVYYRSSRQGSAVLQVEYSSRDALRWNCILHLESSRAGITAGKNKYECKRKNRYIQPNIIFFWRGFFVINRGQNHKPDSLDSYTTKTAKMQKML